MAAYTAYIDESGDEGFVFLGGERGSSRWLVLSAVVFRTSSELQSVAALKEARTLLGKKPKAPLHFRDLSHQHRVPYVRIIAGKSLRTVSVLIYKPGLQAPENFQREPHLLYRYATRLLLERVSWLCRDNKRAEDADCAVDLVFSNRSAMSYEELRDYLRYLQGRAELDDCRIHWPSISPDRVRAVNHDQLAGLQIADAVASGIFYSVNLSPYGEVEPRYMEILAPTAYRHQGRSVLGYGIKFMPALTEIEKTLVHLKAYERFK